jgi:UDP-N-acetylglucosamine:LPS N-acetylglucosamine transferase
MDLVFSSQTKMHFTIYYMTKKILFFSRGRGHGHAIPDMAIADEINDKYPDIVIKFVSYSTGANTFRGSNRDVIDLNLPEQNSFIATLLAAQEIIKYQAPDLVVAHEEFAALPAAASCGTPSAFIAAWLPQSGTISADALRYAQSIIVIDDPGIFPTPPAVRVKPIYTGPFQRKMAFTAIDRNRLRKNLLWEEDEFCIVVAPGGASSEQQAPIVDLIIAAFHRISFRKKRLVWLASNEYDLIFSKLSGVAGVDIVKFIHPVERLLSASDIIITKGTRGITLDARSVGIPSISLSSGRNPIDDTLVPRIHSNLSLVAAAVDGDILAMYIQKLAGNQDNAVKSIENNNQSVQRVSEALIDMIRK